MKKLLLNLFILSVLSLNAMAQISEEKIRSSFKENLKNEQFLNPEKIELHITSQYTSAHNGVTHVYANQFIQGLEIFNVNADMHFNKEGKLIIAHHNFIPQTEKSNITTQAKISPLEALQTGVVSVGLNSTLIANKSAELENGKMIWFEPNISSEKMAVKCGYFAIADQIKMVWQVEFLDNETNDWWNKKIDALSGEIIEQHSYTTHCDFPEKEHQEMKYSFRFEEEITPILNKKSSSGTYHVFPLPLESPNHGPRSLMSNMASPNGSPFGWHDTNGVAGPDFKITRGNNVWAKEDTLANNGTTGFSPNGGDSLIFDFPYDVDNRPRENLNAAITNLFYWNNILHDIFYNYGFNEVSGNYQYKNFTGLGLGKDAVNADAQDGSGTSNANFSAPVDGSSGRMQMYLWPTSSAQNVNNTVSVKYPVSAKGIYYGPQSVAGPRLTSQGLFGKVVLLKDSNASTNSGCGLVANANQFAGNIVLIDRGGTCGTSSSTTRNKVKLAQNSGAIAVIIAHNTNGATPTSLTGTDATITIPSVTIGYGTGVLLKTALQSDSVYLQLFDSSAYIKVRTYDSDLDNGVMTHEYGHGISIRLSGGPNNSSCLGNQEQAGEGWSDFFCLALTTRPWEKSNNVARGIGTFVFDEDTAGLGIRNYKYTRNMSVNPSTYNHVKFLAIPHGVGSVWCTMLYDLYWDMIDKYGFDPDWYNGTGGNNKMMQLVIDGLKLQKCLPGFADARDAILLADSINNGGANTELLWKGFARRGLGYSANQGQSSSRLDGTEAYDLPPFLSGTDELANENNFRMYPNPSNTRITVDVFGGAKVQAVEIYDLSGKMVQSQSFEHNMLPSAGMNLNVHPVGYYLVKIISSEGISFKKLLIN